MSLKVNSQNLRSSERKMGLYFMVTLKKRQQQNLTPERELKAAEEGSVRMEVLPTTRETYIIALDVEDDMKSGLLTVGGSLSLQAPADFDTDFWTTAGTLKEATAELEGQGKWTYPQPKIEVSWGKVVRPRSCKTLRRRCKKECGAACCLHC